MVGASRHTNWQIPSRSVVSLCVVCFSQTPVHQQHVAAARRRARARSKPAVQGQLFGMFLHVFESETKKGPSTTSQNVLENRSKLNLGKNSSPVPPWVPALNVSMSSLFGSALGGLLKVATTILALLSCVNMKLRSISLRICCPTKMFLIYSLQLNAFLCTSKQQILKYTNITIAKY